MLLNKKKVKVRLKKHRKSKGENIYSLLFIGVITTIALLLIQPLKLRI